jgi:hypothetical protein
MHIHPCSCDVVLQASRRLGPAFTREALQDGVQSLEQLLPGLQIDVEAMKASDWVGSTGHRLQQPTQKPDGD